ncbi:MAG: dUTP diphosphatase [Planctomycetota bacterium]
MTEPPVLAFTKLQPSAEIPEYQTEGSVGMDMRACLPGETRVLEPGAIAKIPTGLACAVPRGYEGQVRPRSGLATKHGVTVPNAPGTIDSDYRGELVVALINLGPEAFEIEHGMRVAQLVIAPVAHVRVEVVDRLDETARGTGGFGSTGVR